MALRSVPEHPKFVALKAALGLRKNETMGFLELLWHFTGKYAPQGNIGRFRDAEIEAWLDWGGEQGKLIAALIEARWLDVSAEHRLVVHDWHEHADSTTRKQLGRKKLEFVSTCNGHVPDTSSVNGKTASPPAPAPAPEPAPAPAPAPEAKTLRAVPRAQCELVYAEYPRKVGKEDALKAIAKAVGRLTRGDDIPALSMPEALEYLRRRVQAFARAPAGQRGEMTPHPATWFNKGRYLDDDKEWQETRNGSTGKDREHGHREAPAIERRNITLDASRAAFARRYGPDDSAAVAANGGGLPQSNAAGGDAGHVPRQVGGDGPPLRGGDVSGRVIKGHR